MPTRSSRRNKVVDAENVEPDEVIKSANVSKKAPPKKAAAKARKATTSRKVEKVSTPLAPVVDNEQIEVVEKKQISKNSALYQLGSAMMDAQRSVSTHNRGMITMATWFQKDSATFFATLLPLVDRVLLVFKREKGVERVVNFIARFATQGELLSDEEKDEVMDKLIKHLLSRAGAKDKAVRFRVCQMIALILRTMGEDAEISDDLFEQITAMILVRSRDQIPAVRVEALKALSRLQDTDDPGDPVVKEYLRIMQTDSSKDARVSSLDNIAVAKKTLPSILERTRDVNEVVRAKAYTVIKDKIPVRALAIEQRSELITLGLSDRVEAVRNACLDLVVESWLKSKDGDIIQLLRFLYVETYPETTELLLKQLFAKNITHTNENPPFKADDLTAERALYWRVLCEERAKKSWRNNSSELLPDAVEFCDLIENAQGHPFILSQLLKLCSHLDSQDEVGRRKLVSLLQSLICNLETPHVSIPDLVFTLRSVCAEDEKGFIRMVLESISEIRDPLDQPITEEEEAQRTQLEEVYQTLKAELSSLSAAKIELVRSERYEEAAALKRQVEGTAEKMQDVEEQLAKFTRQDSDESWYRMLSIIVALLQSSRNRIKLNHPGIMPLLSEMILPAFELTVPECREQAMLGLGLFCLMDQELALSHLPIVLGALANDEGVVQLAAVKVVFDLLMVNVDLLPMTAEKTFDENGDEEDGVLTVQTITDTLIDFLKEFEKIDAAEEDDEMRTFKQIIVEGLTKLALFDRIPDAARLLRIFMTMYFDADAHKEFHLQQCLTQFFPSYTMVNPAEHATALLDAYVGTISDLVDRKVEPKTVNKCSQFFVYLLSSYDKTVVPVASPTEGDVKSDEVAIANRSTQSLLALTSFYHIIVRGSGPMVKPLAYALSLMNFDDESELMCVQLSMLVTKALEEVDEKSVITLLKKVSTRIHARITQVDSVLADAQIQKFTNEVNIGLEKVTAEVTTLKKKSKNRRKGRKSIMFSPRKSKGKSLASRRPRKAVLPDAEECEELPATRKAIFSPKKRVIAEKKTTAAKKRKPALKKTKAVESSEEDSSSEEETQVVAAPVRRTRRAAAKKVSYAQQEEESSDDPSDESDISDSDTE